MVILPTCAPRPPLTDYLPTRFLLYHQIIAGDEGCRQWDVWAHAYAEGSHMAWGGWLAQNTAWWQAHERHPEQAQRTSPNLKPKPNANPNPNPNPEQAL